ncbi:signal peptidase I [Nocardioides sp. Leaf307]|uniref:signal peptidase I n=1 Tax=Nocardioides sp. Leaf307 TaxID=1736331 RepID=UPI0009EB010C|nr:signal peptidase I [Nocardioides sp. Leaf307]
MSSSTSTTAATESCARHRGDGSSRVVTRPTAGGALHVLGNVVTSLVLVACLAAFLLLAVGPHVFGYRTATMLTGSMEPGISPGDVVVTVPRPAADVEVGDVISYHIPIEDHRVETHRVTKVVRGDDGSIAVQTQGDANEGVDPWTATLEGDTVWQMTAVVPHVGKAIQWLRAPVVQHGVLWGALGLLVVLGLVRIWARDEDEEPGTRSPGTGTPETADGTDEVLREPAGSER